MQAKINFLLILIALIYINHSIVQGGEIVNHVHFPFAYMIPIFQVFLYFQCILYYTRYSILYLSALDQKINNALLFV